MLQAEHGNNLQNQTSQNIAAYFDFDGTLTFKDTLVPFLIHCVGWAKFIISLPCILPYVILYLLNMITNEEAKQRTITVLLKGRTFADIEKQAMSFAYGHISKYIKPQIFARLEYHKEHGHKVILISANLAIYLRYWAIIHKIDGVIGTEIEFVDNIANGKLATRNCYGIHKLLRLRQYLEENKIDFTYSYGYGNSRGDFELLDYVNEGYWVDGEELSLWSGRHMHA